MINRKLKSIAFAVAVGALIGCGSTPSTPVSKGEENRLDNEVKATIADFRQADPGIDNFFRNAYGYAVFPDVTAAALVVGGAHGKGEVFRNRGNGNADFVGYADVSKGNVGAQIGGQSYAQVVFFENQGSFAEFTSGSETEFDAKASAVAASAGASTSANYQKGVLVFTHAKGGLMAQAAIGGQKFRFIPGDVADAQRRADDKYGLTGDRRDMPPDNRNMPRDDRDVNNPPR